MKSKHSSHNNANLAKTIALGLGLAVAGFSIHSAGAQTTWDGGGGTNVLNTDTNWTTDTLPSTSAAWDGTQSGNLSLVWNADLGDGANGMSLNVSTGQTGTLNLNAANGTALLNISSINVASGTAAFSIGNGDLTAASTVFRGTNTLTNNSANTVTFQSDVLFNSGGGSVRTLTFAGSGNWTFNSGLYAQGTGGFGLNVNGSSSTTVTLNGASAAAARNSGINFGTLKLTNGDALGTSGAATLSIANGGGVKRLALSNDIALNGAVANIVISATTSAPDNNSTSASILNESGSNSIAGNISVTFGGANINIHSQAGTLTLNGGVSTAAGITSARNVNFAGAGDIIVNGAISDGTGQVGISKMGTGTTTLTSANTYTAGTTVNAGTLLVNNSTGSGAGTAAVSVNNGGTFGGTGSISGDVTVNSGGTLAPGASIESLGAGSLTLNDDSTFSFELNTTSPAADLLFASDASASLNLNGSVTLSLTDLGSDSPLAFGTKFTLISYNTGWNNGTFNGFADDSTFAFAGNEWLINYDDTSAGINFNADAISFGTSFVTITVIPEPSTFALIGFVCLGGVLARSRRRLARC